MRKVAFLVALVVLIPSLGFAAADSPAGLDRCLGCHRLGGKGDAKGSDLLWTSGEWTRSAVVAQLWNHGERMWKKFETNGKAPELTPADLEAIFAALNAERPFTAEPKADVVAGSLAFQQKRCAECHESRGLGCAAGESLSIERMASQLWRDIPRMREVIGKRGWPKLTGPDVRNLLAFCRQVPAPKPPAR